MYQSNVFERPEHISDFAKLSSFWIYPATVFFKSKIYIYVWPSNARYKNGEKTRLYAIVFTLKIFVGAPVLMLR